MIYIDIHFHGLYVCVFSYSFIGAETALVTHLPYTFSSPLRTHPLPSSPGHEGRRGSVPGGEGGGAVRHTQAAVGEAGAVRLPLKESVRWQAGLAEAEGAGRGRVGERMWGRGRANDVG